MNDILYEGYPIMAACSLLEKDITHNIIKKSTIMKHYYIVDDTYISLYTTKLYI